MSNPVVSAIKGSIAFVTVALNTIIVFSCMIPFALLKLVFRGGSVRKLIDRTLNGLAYRWVRINGLWIAMMQRIRWDVSGIEGVSVNGWYLVNSNHQSWVDILVLQKIFSGRIPFLKFFLKRELIYVPVIGLAWWALDFPFMKRRAGVKGGRSDLAETRKACERFKRIPTSVMNFLEGTRFTPAKHRQQRSTYRNLLKPKIGGLATALGSMGENFDCMLDVTIHYPKGVPTFWDLLSGKVSEIVVRVRAREIPSEMLNGDYERDAAYRSRVQTWVQEIWTEKDRLLDDLKRQTGAAGAGS